MSMSESPRICWAAKVGMMRIFTDDGDAIPVTVLDVSNNRVTQVKTVETDGWRPAGGVRSRKASASTSPRAPGQGRCRSRRNPREFRVAADAASTSAGAWCR